MSDSPGYRPWRRFLRFSIGGLIVGVLLAGAGLGWLVRADRTERETVASVLRAGGWLVHDGEPITANTIHGLPSWTVSRLEDLIEFEPP